MSRYARMVEAGFLHLLAASIVIGFAIQAQWAMEHNFEFFDARMLATAALVFLVFQGVRLILLRSISAEPARLNRQYSDSVLLLAVLSAFLVIENLFLRVVGTICYTLLVLQYMTHVLEIRWAQDASAWLHETVPEYLGTASARGLRYSVKDDLEPGVLEIKLRAGSRPPSMKSLKETVAALYQDLPDQGAFEEIRVNVKNMQRIDETLVRCLEAVANYAAMLNIDKVSVVTATGSEKELRGLLPAGRFEIAAAAQ